ncbi:MAG: hypothetical protein L0L63_08320 [Staphylococcus equorum]|nr:hypothetical protein [Staphylococcus equorum]
MRKLIKGITKIYLYTTSAYFTYISIVFFISTYKNYKLEKENKSYINSVNEFANVLKDAGYFNKEV